MIFSSKNRHSQEQINSIGRQQECVLPDPVPASQKKAERYILVLYIAFFLMWTSGLVLGLGDNAGQTLLFGLPLWFTLGAVLSYPCACVLLLLVVRRYFS